MGIRGKAGLQVVAELRHDDDFVRAINVHLLALAVGGLVLGGMAILAAVLDVSGGILSREPQVTLDGPYYTGVLSNLGALVWMAGVVIALAGVATSGEPDVRRMYLAAAAVGAVLLIDDFFLVHDWLGGKSGLAGKALIFSYLLAMMALLLVFWRTMGPATTSTNPLSNPSVR